MLCLLSISSVCCMYKNCNWKKKRFGSLSSMVLYFRNCLCQQNAALSRSVCCCILMREYCMLMTNYLSSYSNTFIFTKQLLITYSWVSVLEKVLKYSQCSFYINLEKKKKTQKKQAKISIKVVVNI